MIKYIALTILLFLIPFATSNVAPKEAAPAYTLLHINAKWNQYNNVNFGPIPNCRLKFAFLEDQPDSFRSKIQYVPHVVLLKNNRPVAQWSADLSFKLDITTQDILNVINSDK